MADFLQDSPMLVALDLGTSHFGISVSQVDRDWNLLPVTQSSPKPTNADFTATINAALTEMEKTMGCDLANPQFILGIPARFLGTLDAHGQILVQDSAKVQQKHIDEALAVAERSVEIPDGYERLALIPSRFVLANQETTNPLGCLAGKLEVDAQIICMESKKVSHITSALQNNGMPVACNTPSILAAASLALSENEKQRGVVLINMGAQYAEVAIWVKGALYGITQATHFDGDHLTSQIGAALHIQDFEIAEALKQESGTCIANEEDKGVRLAYFTSDKTKPNTDKWSLAQIIAGILKEAGESFAASLERNSIKHKLKSGIVLLGGASKLPGLCELLQNATGLSVRLGDERAVLDGLLEFGKNQLRTEALSKQPNWVKRLFKKLF
jgi:cell division protein FtsA